MVFMGNGGGLDYTLIQSIRGGTVENWLLITCQ